MQREPRKKTWASKKSGSPSKKTKLGSSSNNLGGTNEERLVKPFLKLVNFRYEGHRKKFEQIVHIKIIPNRYMSASTLKEVEVIDEVIMYVNRMGWNDFVMM